MTRTIDYYFATISPYAYLGHDRFVAIAQQHGAADGTGQCKRLRRPRFDRREYPMRGQVAVHRKELRLDAHRLAQVPRPALEFDQPVGLPLRRALRQRQPARNREHFTEVDRLHRNGRTVLLREGD